jgi:hypothetical protein
MTNALYMAVDSLLAALLAAERNSDGATVRDIKGDLSRIGVSLEERRSGYVWRLT